MRLRYLLVLVMGIGCSKAHDAGGGGDPKPAEDSERIEEGSAEDRFSFFVTSLQSLRELSGSQSGFGGDLRFGETGDGAGLRGADKICATIADISLPGSSGRRRWRAFLSTSTVDARDRIGEGPWYDRQGRLVARDLDALLTERPDADPAIINDLPNEFGVPNHDPDGTGQVDNHDMLTGTNSMGTLYCPDDPAVCTCDDWTNAEPTGRPRVGHSWPRSGTSVDFGALFDGGLPGFPGGGFPGFADGGLPGFPGGGFAGLADGGLSGFPGGGFPGFGDGGFPGFGDGGFPGFGGGGFPGFGGDGSVDNWISALDEAGCAPGVSLIEMGPPQANNPTVGSGGGYGGFYCFALAPE